ncbi:MAG: hypothetical protein ACTSRZ_17470 [Promethearchaeota archaeon]
MEIKIEEICYRVFFSQTLKFKENDAALAFFGPLKPFKIYKSNLYFDLTKIVDRNENFYSIHLIRNVVFLEEFIKQSDFSSFYILLIKEKDEDTITLKRKGFLLGSHKSNEDYILGIWPYIYYSNIKNKFSSAEDKLLSLLKKQDNIENMLLVSQI